MCALNNVILFGFRGCGKSTIAPLLAKRLSYSCLDSDLLITQLHAQKTGTTLSPRAIYHTVGAAYFRSLEKEVIEIFSQVNKSVIALGAGAVLDGYNLEILRKIGIFVYLEASLELIKSRNTLPLEKSLEELYFERLSGYRSIEALYVPVDGFVENELVEHIYKKLEV